MNGNKTKRWITSGSFLSDRKLAITLWFGLSLCAILLELLHHRFNNYLIFKYVFIHTTQHLNLYLPYPGEYVDVNLYGPLFSILIAPFTLLPDWLGVVCWGMFNTAVLYFAVRKLPISEKWQNTLLILCAHEMMNAASWLQSNPLIAACIIVGFVYIQEGKDARALFFILLASFIKLYGIVGFAFFFFSRDKLNFIKWAVIWSVFFLVIPVILAPPSFIVQSYQDWFGALQFKAHKNVRLDIHNDFQDISVMGMIRRIFNIPGFKNILVTIPAVFLFGLQYLRYRYFSDIRYRLYLLCSVLITTVIFTTSAESPTYIIAFPAVCLWFVLQPPAKWVNAVFIFALLLTSFSYSDLFTPYVRTHFIRPYSLKALPCFVLWLIIGWQILSKQFLSVDMTRGQHKQPKKLKAVIT
jgi:hypothetical protein